MHFVIRSSLKVDIKICNANVITSPPEGVARYCFHPVCLSVCLSVCVCICVSGLYFGILFIGY